jgi:hypothetical protein
MALFLIANRHTNRAMQVLHINRCISLGGLVLALLSLSARPSIAQTGARVTLTPRNVVTDTLTIELTGFRSYNLTLLNEQGRLVWSQNNATKPVHRLPMAAWPAGKYYLRVFGSAESFAESFEFRYTPRGQ